MKPQIFQHQEINKKPLTSIQPFSKDLIINFHNPSSVRLFVDYQKYMFLTHPVVNKQLGYIRQLKEIAWVIRLRSTIQTFFASPSRSSVLSSSSSEACCLVRILRDGESCDFASLFSSASPSAGSTYREMESYKIRYGKGHPF